jgi:hypothetical protein
MIRSVIAIPKNETRISETVEPQHGLEIRHTQTNAAMIISSLHLQQNNMRSNHVYPRLLESFEKSYFECQLCTVMALLEYPNVTL